MQGAPTLEPPAAARDEPARAKPEPPRLTVHTHLLAEADTPCAGERSSPASASLRPTALHVAVSAADVPTVMRLLAEGHPIDVGDELGATPLHNAAALTKAEPRAVITELLLEHRADVQRWDNDGCTCLHTAAACGHLDVIELVIAAGADPRDRTKQGETALHKASRFGRLDAVRLIMQHGGPRLALEQDIHFETALDVAATGQNRIRSLRGHIREAILEVLFVAAQNGVLAELGTCMLRKCCALILVSHTVRTIGTDGRPPS